MVKNLFVVGDVVDGEETADGEDTVDDVEVVVGVVNGVDAAVDIAADGVEAIVDDVYGVDADLDAVEAVVDVMDGAKTGVDVVEVTHEVQTPYRRSDRVRRPRQRLIANDDI